jgi:ABC-type phosphate transport system auxiliary subunit
MSTESKTEAKTEKVHDRRLSDLVAVTVVILTVFLAVCKVKDDNIVQAMQKALLTSVDAWAEYQSTRVKLHVDENGLSTLRLLETIGTIDKALAAKQAAEYEADVKKYQERSRETRAKAERLEKEYERLNFRDDQFDVSEAFVSIAIALAAVAALVDAYWMLYIAWSSGGLGLLFGAAGFANVHLRPEWLANLLGT